MRVLHLGRGTCRFDDLAEKSDPLHVLRVGAGVTCLVPLGGALNLRTKDLRLPKVFHSTFSIVHLQSTRSNPAPNPNPDANPQPKQETKLSRSEILYRALFFLYNYFDHHMSACEFGKVNSRYSILIIASCVTHRPLVFTDELARKENDGSQY